MAPHVGRFAGPKEVFGGLLESHRGQGGANTPCKREKVGMGKEKGKYNAIPNLPVLSVRLSQVRPHIHMRHKICESHPQVEDC